MFSTKMLEIKQKVKCAFLAFFNEVKPNWMNQVSLVWEKNRKLSREHLAPFLLSSLLSYKAMVEIDHPRPARTGRCTLLCTATDKKFVPSLFWTATKTNYTSKCSDFQKKVIDTISTSNLYFKENNENEIAAQVFLGVFFSIPADGRSKLAQQLM